MAESFDYEVWNLPDDYEGKVISTLIKSKKNHSERHAVLYVHGFFDYFFHPHLAELFLQHHYNFYALDLRKCGRSLLPHQHSNYCRDLSEYFEEIDKAIDIKKSNTIFQQSNIGFVSIRQDKRQLTAYICTKFAQGSSWGVGFQP